MEVGFAHTSEAGFAAKPRRASADADRHVSFFAKSTVDTAGATKTRKSAATPRRTIFNIAAFHNARPDHKQDIMDFIARNSNCDGAQELHALLASHSNNGGAQDGEEHDETSFQSILQERLQELKDDLVEMHTEALKEDRGAIQKTQAMMSELQEENQRLRSELSRAHARRSSKKSCTRQDMYRSFSKDDEHTGKAGVNGKGGYAEANRSGLDFSNVGIPGTPAAAATATEETVCSDMAGDFHGRATVQGEGTEHGPELARGSTEMEALEDSRAAGEEMQQTKGSVMWKPEGPDTESSEGEGGMYVLQGIWENSKKAHARNATARSMMTKRPQQIAKAVFADSLIQGGGHAMTQEVQQSRLAQFMSRFMLQHTSKPRVSWDLINAMLLLYLCIATPLQMFDIEETTFTIAMVWGSRLFWSLDMLVMFMTTFEDDNGHIESDPEKVAKHYLATWFLLDFFLVSLDWGELALANDGSEQSGATHAGKFLKVLRYIRLLRLVRVMSSESLSLLSILPRSDVLEMSMTVLKTFLWVIFMNHFMACMWYGVAGLGDVNSSWVSAFGLLDNSLFDKYIHSYHWSLTNFHSSSDINPANTIERFFTIFAVVFAFFAAAIVVSNLTSAMTRFEIIRTTESSKLNLLRQFLVDNGISNQLAYRISKHARSKIQHLKRNLPEASVDLLAIVSDPLLQDLHCEMHNPVLCVHPFLGLLQKRSPLLMRKVCHEAAERLTVMSGDVVFMESEVAAEPKLYIVMSGRLSYLQRDRGMVSVSKPSWISEGNLWVHWSTLGAMIAVENTALLALDVIKFQELSKHSSVAEFGFIRRYAKFYCDTLNDMVSEELADADTLAQDVRTWVANHLEPDEDDSATLRQAFRSRMKSKTTMTSVFGS